MVMVHNREFVNGILERYRADEVDYYLGTSLVYRMKKERSRLSLSQKFIKRLLAKEIYVWMKKYEQKYYQKITNEDNRRFIHTVEQIYSQPGDKKQLIYMFQKLGVVTKNQSDWQETQQSIQRYEEEITRLRQQVKLQENSIIKLSVQEENHISSKELTREVMERIKSEIRMERLRYGFDS